MSSLTSRRVYASLTAEPGGYGARTRTPSAAATYAATARPRNAAKGTVAMPMKCAFTQEKYDNAELYIGGSWKWLSLKYNYSLTNYFGFNDNVARNFFSRTCASGGACGAVAGKDFVTPSGDSKGTGYLDLTANYEIAPKVNLVGHIGRLMMKNYGSFFNYTDYKIGATYDWTGWILGAAIVGTNANKEWNYVAGAPFNTTTGVPKIESSGEPTIVLSVSKTF